MMRVEPINKHTVLKQVRTNGTWEGYIAPNMVNSFHITDGWHLGHKILISIGRDGKYYVVSWYNEYKELEDTLNSFKYYNCNSELGKTVKFWEVN
jgi:hypothetical protein